MTNAESSGRITSRRSGVAILPMNMHKSYRVQELAEKLYAELSAKGIDVLMDDRKERPRRDVC